MVLRGGRRERRARSRSRVVRSRDGRGARRRLAGSPNRVRRSLRISVRARVGPREDGRRARNVPRTRRAPHARHRRGVRGGRGRRGEMRRVRVARVRRGRGVWRREPSQFRGCGFSRANRVSTLRGRTRGGAVRGSGVWPRREQSRHVQGPRKRRAGRRRIGSIRAVVGGDGASFSRVEGTEIGARRRRRRRSRRRAPRGDGRHAPRVHARERTHQTPARRAQGARRTRHGHHAHSRSSGARGGRPRDSRTRFPNIFARPSCTSGNSTTWTRGTPRIAPRTRRIFDERRRRFDSSSVCVRKTPTRATAAPTPERARARVRVPGVPRGRGRIRRRRGTRGVTLRAQTVRVVRGRARDARAAAAAATPSVFQVPGRVACARPPTRSTTSARNLRVVASSVGPRRARTPPSWTVSSARRRNTSRARRRWSCGEVGGPRWRL